MKQYEIRNTRGRLLYSGNCATLSDAIWWARIREVSLVGADLRGVELSGADLTDLDLTDANLSGADLTLARLDGVNLRRANMRSANLTGARLPSACLLSADMTGAILGLGDLFVAKATAACGNTDHHQLTAIKGTQSVRVIGGGFDGHPDTLRADIARWDPARRRSMSLVLDTVLNLLDATVNN
jgi:hypothetical protein